MDAHFKIEGLVDELADAVAERLRGLLPTPAQTEELPGEILGLRPYALYSVADVAERWGVTRDYVRKLPAEDLPRASWQGGEIRYRGIDILRYEGVDVEEHLPENVKPLERSEDAVAPPRRRGAGEKDVDAEISAEASPSRPYNDRLPEL